MKAIYKRVLLKLSGESLQGEQGFGIDPQRVAIVIGGGNIFRGLKGAAQGFDRVKGDQMGMLATVINSIALSSGLDAVGQPSKVLTAINMFPIGEQYSKWRAIEAMEQGKVAIMSCGTGNPFFTTDTGSALRGIEVEAEVMLKGTRVDGIYPFGCGDSFQKSTVIDGFFYQFTIFVGDVHTVFHENISYLICL